MEIAYQEYLAWAAKLYPDREMHYLVLGSPIPGMDLEGHNNWMAAQMAEDTQCEVNMMVTPDITPDYVAAQVRKYNFFGLKPYRFFAPDPINYRIQDFLHESFIEVAHDMGLAITMHLSKKTGAADPENLKTCSTTPKSTRRPNGSWRTVPGPSTPSLRRSRSTYSRDMPNIRYVASAVNEIYSYYLLMKQED